MTVSYSMAPKKTTLGNWRELVDEFLGFKSMNLLCFLVLIQESMSAELGLGRKSTKCCECSLLLKSIQAL